MLSTAQFVEKLNKFEQFASAFDEAEYCPLPPDWFVACSDVIGSRKEIAKGNFRQVNMVGVAMISAIMNELGHQNLPFVFGGDGAAIAFAPCDHDEIAKALGETVTWAKEVFELELRAAIVPVSELIDRCSQVLVKRLRLSNAASSFAFGGGGLVLAENLMKQGEFCVLPAKAGSKPNLDGLSCRWMPVAPSKGQIISLIVQAAEGKGPQFGALCEEICQRCGMGISGMDQSSMEQDLKGSPVSADKMKFRWPPKMLKFEVASSRENIPTKKLRRKLLIQSFFQFVSNFTGITIGGYQPKRYRKFLALNTDYRKFQDGLKATLEMEEQQLADLKEWLEEKHQQGILDYGLSVQDSAIVTCFVPSFKDDNHIHFLDGAGGGYAEAASDLGSKN